MPKNEVNIPKSYLHSRKLNVISRKVVDLAFMLGGSPGKYFNGVKCNYIFPDGTACFNQERGDHNIDCPLCKGNGAYYEEPKDISIIVMDSVNPLSGDKYGAIFEDNVSLSVPVYINPSIIKVSKQGQMYIVKDKFAVYDHQSDLWAIFTMDSEPFEPYLAGPLYRVVNVTSQYTQVQDGEHEEPKIYYNLQETDLLSEVNKEILEINSEITNEYVDTDNTNVVLTSEEQAVIIERPSSLEDDWE